MTNNSLKVRLFVEQSLVAEELLTLAKDQFHYLRNVLRVHEGDRIGLFNGLDGEWETEITELGKKK